MPPMSATADMGVALTYKVKLLEQASLDPFGGCPQLWLA